MKTLLTASESAKLIKLGVSSERASNMWVKSSSRSYTCEKNNLLLDTLAWRKENVSNSENYGFIFTLADILDILPKKVKIHRDGDTLSMIYHCGQWRVGYSNCAEYCNHTKVAPELIDALYSLLLWCLEKGYVK